MKHDVTRRAAIAAGALAAAMLLGRRPWLALAQEGTASPAAGDEAFQVPGYPPLSPDPTLLELLEVRGEMALVRDASGEVAIPRNPERVAALDEISLEMLLALGITPVASGHFGSRFPVALEGMVEGVTSFPQRDLGIDVEAVLAAEPELIVTAVGFDQPFMDQVRKIAPTLQFIEFPARYWRSGIAALADVLGREEPAVETIAAFDAQVLTARERVKQLAGSEATFDTILFFADGVWLYAPVFGFEGTVSIDGATQWLYRDLAQSPSSSIAELVDFEEGFLQLSLEVLPELKGEYLVVFPGGYEANPAPGYAEFIADPFWQNVPAVRDGKVITLFADRSAGPFTSLYVIDQFVTALNAASNGGMAASPVVASATP